MVMKPLAFLPHIALLLVALFVIHLLVKMFTSRSMARSMVLTEDDPYINAFRRNTRFWSSVFSARIAGWGKATKESVAEVIDHSSMFVQRLNDQFTNPSGSKPDHTL